MATYTYHCDFCDEPFEKILPMAQYADPQSCPTCGRGPSRKTISGGTGFILKGDDWVSKNNRIRGQMTANRQKAGSRQTQKVKDTPGVTLVPNVAGERTESWSDASKLAASKGKDTSGYNKRAQKESK